MSWAGSFCPGDTDPWKPSLCAEQTTLAAVPPAVLFVLGAFQLPELVRRYRRAKETAVPGRRTYATKLTVLALLAVLQVLVVAQVFLEEPSHARKAGEAARGLRFASSMVNLVAYVFAFFLEKLSHPRLPHSSTPLLFWSLSDLALAALSLATVLNAHSPAQPHGLLLAVIAARLALLSAFFSLELLGPQGFNGMTWRDFVPFVASRGKIRLVDDEARRLLGEDEDTTPRPSPYTKANIFQRMSFEWLTPLMQAGSTKYLSEEDLWALPAEDTAHALSTRLEQAWLKRYKESTDRPSLLKALGTAYGGPFLTGLFLKLLDDTFAFAQPLLLKYLLQFVASYGTKHGEPSSHGYLVGVGMFLCSILQTVLLQAYFSRAFETGMRIRTGLVSLIYKKALVLSPSERASRSTGDIVNLQSTDTARLDNFCAYAGYLPSAVYQIIFTLYLLYRFLGWSMLASIVVICASIPLTGVVAKYQGELQTQQIKYKDERTSLMSEILSNARLIKLYAWENPFKARLSAVRNDKELATLKRMGVLWAAAFFLWQLVPFAVSFAAFAACSLVSKRPLTVDVVFPAMALFQMLQIPLSILPPMIGQLMESLVSIRRITDFLLAEELQGTVKNEVPSRELKIGDEVVSVRNADFTWSAPDSPGPKTLEDISLSVKKGSLVAVVGQVGSGKSSLLSALLGEMHHVGNKGDVTLRGTVAYCQQQPWIMGGTVKSNITFGHRFEADFYELVLEACALKDDLKVLPAGDETEVGEKGVSLSGGQKARIALARAVYARADIYLLDDPLAAVDSHVARHLFERVIGPAGLLKDRARILSTHALPFCREADELVFLRKGIILERSTFADAIRGNTDLSKLLLEFGKASKDSVGGSTDGGDDDTVVEETLDESALAAEDSDVKAKIAQSKSVLLRRAQPLPVQEELRETLTALRKGSKRQEKRERGQVKLDVYKEYIRSNGWFNILFYAFAAVAFQATAIGTNVWLKRWAQHNGDGGNAQPAFYLSIYAALGLTSSILFGGASAISFCFCAIKSAKRLHDRMFDNVIRLPLLFFETTPAGTILNRFAADVSTIDHMLPRMAANYFRGLSGVIGMIFVLIVSAPPVLIILVPLLFLYTRVQRYYLATSRELKRLDSTTKSPIFALFSETLNGLATIRSARQPARFIAKNDAWMDRNMQAYSPSFLCNRWLAVRLGYLSATLILGVTFISIFMLSHSQAISAGLIGLMLTYALQATQELDWLVRSAVEVETNIVCVERVLEYTNLATEAAYEVPERQPPEDWPQRGSIRFDGVSARYRNDLDLALRKISFEVKAGEKVGVCGRTGAGKSSLTMVLYRIIEAESGVVSIDGVDLSTLGLGDLRSRLSILPQDAQLYSGTLRQNLDPVGEYSDDQLWAAFEQCKLKEFALRLDGHLDGRVEEGGANLSAGQRQLACLVRALLRRRKILVLDEATAAVDHESDRDIQAVIREAFATDTIFVIAHRLNTIMDCDRILVLDAGQVAEFDSPANLLQREGGIFRSLAVEAGLAEA
ncbi:hypothetical protein JCM6882_001133 [Rhodosporidiobolus microsporus]